MASIETMASIEKSSVQESSPLAFLSNNALSTALLNKYEAFHEKRNELGLPNPGTTERINSEVMSGVFATGHMFSGLRAEITKPFSMSPLFQVAHSFSIGSNLPAYNFAALYGTNNVFCQATVNNEFQSQNIFNYRWTKQLITRTNVQIAPGQGAMFETEGAWTGKDFSATVKTLNPGFLDGGLTGIYVGQYLQSVTPRLALGMEAIWQRQALSVGPESALSYFGKYKGDDWIVSAQLQAQGEISTSYWKKLTEKLQGGVNFSLQFAGLGQGDLLSARVRKEGITTAGVKYDFRLSSFRAQVDSNGKLCALLERKIAQPVSVSIAAEVDHLKSSAKVGISVSLETPPDDPEAFQSSEISIPF